tara:strand:- start:214721 stop:214912 length:192 start_codon:yes stop_codon:yes gene_type:complete
MNDDELDIPKGSHLKELTLEDLTVHSVAALKERIKVLEAEVKRTEQEIDQKKTAHADADSLFK